MPLPSPPDQAGSLAGLPGRALRASRLFRVWRHDLPGGASRSTPWWFASANADETGGGRFDLPEPMGTCYFGTRPESALLEALQARLVNLPREELTVRRMARVTVPAEAPDAAMLTARRVAGEFGITAELWAGGNRALTRRWAGAIRRDGWWAIYAGVAHDPSGRLRAVALFDHAGEHAPTVGGRWRWTSRRLDADDDLERALQRFGVTVREPGRLRWAKPPGNAPRSS
ncbi:MAG: RES family NAD+ phosphorylase [Arenicellales bacterium]